MNSPPSPAKAKILILLVKLELKIRKAKHRLLKRLRREELVIDRPCHHCQGAKYVFPYRLDEILQKHHLHLTEIPAVVLEKFPLEIYRHCHCNICFFFTLENEIANCLECHDTSWRFSKRARQWGWKTITELSPSELKLLNCRFFERCECEAGVTLNPEARESLREALHRLGISNLQSLVPIRR